MREHIHREANQYVDATGWLVAVVFAIAALAVVALSTSDADDAPSQAVAAVPAATPAATPAAKSQAEEPAAEVEHIQAF